MFFYALRKHKSYPCFFILLTHMNFVFNAFLKAHLFSWRHCLCYMFINPKQLQVCFFLLSSLSLRLTQPITRQDFHTVNKALGSFSLIFSFTFFARGGFCLTEQKDRKRSQKLKATDEIWWRMSMVVPSCCPPLQACCASSASGAHVWWWQQVRLHHKTDHCTRIPELQLHKLPQVLTNDITTKCNQSNMIKTLWLPGNTEQKLLQYL